MSALNSSSLPPIKLKNSQKYLVISYASPVICLMPATRETVCICQDQKHHSGHVMSAFVNPSLSPLCLPSPDCYRGADACSFSCSLPSPLAHLCYLEVPWLKGQGEPAPAGSRMGSGPPCTLRWSQTQD